MGETHDIFSPQVPEEGENKHEIQEMEKLNKQINNNKKEIGDLIEINKHISNLNTKWYPHQVLYEDTAAAVAKLYWVEDSIGYKADINTDELFGVPDSDERTITLMEERHNKVFNLLKKLYTGRNIIRPKFSAELDILTGITNYQATNRIEKQTE